MLDLPKRLDKLLVLRHGQQVCEELAVGEPLVGAEGVGDEGSELRVALQKPSTRGDTVGDIGEEIAALELHKVAEDRALQQLRVQLGHTVHFHRADNGEESHADVLGRALFDDGHAADAVHVAGPSLSDLSEEFVVDLVDDLQVTRQQALEEAELPLLERLGQDGVVGVCKDLAGDLPSLGKAEIFLVDQDTDELGYGDSRVRVVHLDDNVVRKLAVGHIELVESTENVLQRSRAPQILLAEPKELALVHVVVGIQHLGDVPNIRACSDRSLVVARVERVEIEPGLRDSLPETDVSRVLGAVSGDRGVVGLGKTFLTPRPDRPVRVRHVLDVSVEPDRVGHIETGDLPRAFTVEPRVGRFQLLAGVAQQLLEDTVLVAQTVAPAWQVEGSHTVDVAGCQSTETAVTKTGIALLVEQVLEIETQLASRLLVGVTHAQVEDGVVERPAQQPLDREVVDSLGAPGSVVPSGLVPSLDELVAD